MLPILITGSTQEDRLAKAKSIISGYKLPVASFNNHPDVLIINPKPSIKIIQVRQLQTFLSRKPYQAAIKVVIVAEAEKLTLAAQNCFLKTLEEPPSKSLIILGSQIPEQLLPTIISRCQIISLIPKDEIKLEPSLITNHKSLAATGQALITKLIKSSLGQRLLLIEPYEKSREEAIKFCEEMIVSLRKILINQELASPKIKPNFTRQQLLLMLKSLQLTLNLIKANVNVKLCLDNLVLNLPKDNEKVI